MSMRWKIAVLVDPITALVTDASHPFGLSAQLSARGHEVRVFGPPPGLSEDRSNAPRLGASVALFGPDAVVAYDALSPAAWVGARAARRRNLPLVLIEAGPWAGGGPLQRTLWRVGESLWGRYVRRTAAAVLALEPQARERSIRRGFAPDQVHEIAHGVDIDLHRPGLANAELAAHRIGGRILSCRTSYTAPDEVEHLIEAFSKTVGQRQDWSLVFVGDAAAPARVAKCAHRSGVGARVHFLSLRNESIASLLSSSTLFAALEDSGVRAVWDVERALACGTPVLIPDATRGRHLVQHDVNGWVTPGNDAAAWTAALRRAAASPEARRRWGMAARRYALEHLGWGGVALAIETAIGGRLGFEAELAQHAARQAARQAASA